MTCEECKNDLRPSDPSVGWVNLNWKRNHPHEYPKYDPPLCDACPDKPVEKTIQEVELTPMRIYMNIDRKSMELQKRIALLESQVNSLKEKKGGEGYVNKFL